MALWIGAGPPCSAVLVHRQWGLTARHCVTTDYSTGGTLKPPTTFYTSRSLNPGNTFSTSKYTNQVVAFRDFHPTPTEDGRGLHSPQDLILFYLNNEESGWAPLYPGYAQTNLYVTMYGYGLKTPGGNDGGVLRYANSNVEDNSYNEFRIFANSAHQWASPGDSGGPTYVFQSDFVGRTNWYLLGLHSHVDDYNNPSTTHDVHLNAFKGWLKRQIFVPGDVDGDGVADITVTGVSGWTTLPFGHSNGDGTFTLVNPYLPNFPTWAATAGAKAVSGDFNGDGRSDVALTGPSSWATVPTALATGTSFVETNFSAGNFPLWASQQGAIPLPGDFDGDGRDDIALVGGTNWNTIPIAFSQGGGTWAVTNFNVADFPTYAQQAGAKPVVGDFDADGRADIALVGGTNWTTVPFAFSNGDGTFTVSNVPASTFAGYAKQSGVIPVSGEFMGGGGDGIALVGGPNWTTIPVLSPVVQTAGDGHSSSLVLNVTNYTVSNFPAWSRTTGAKPVAGDFNGDGLADIALVGGSGWNSVPIAVSQGDGHFQTWNAQSPTFVNGASGVAGAKSLANHKAP
jgi:hypothetical protein